MAHYMRLPNGVFQAAKFNVQGNGTTDDTAKLQEMASEAAAYALAYDTGARIELPYGKFRVSDTIAIQEDVVHLVGGGGGGDLFTPYGTCLVPTEDFPDDKYVLEFSVGSKVRTLHSNRLENISVMKENGETLANTVHGILWQVAKGRMDGVTVDNMTGRGLGIQGFSSSWKTTYSKFLNSHFRRSGTHGVEILGSSADMFFTNCVFDGNSGAGLYNPGAGNLYLACHFTGNLNNVKFAGGSSECEFIGCMLETPREHNILVDVTTGSVTSLRVIGNRFDSNALTAADTYSAISFQRDSGGNTASAIVANNAFSSSGTNKPLYHVNLSGGAALGILVRDNSYSVLAAGAVNHNASAVRCLVNGLGHNVGDPTSTGEWFGFGEEGVRVVDDSNILYSYANGAWR